MSASSESLNRDCYEKRNIFSVRHLGKSEVPQGAAGAAKSAPPPPSYRGVVEVPRSGFKVPQKVPQNHPPELKFMSRFAAEVYALRVTKNATQEVERD